MSGRSDECERTLAFADIALGQIKALGQPAYPRNYEVWYAYATGYNPSLNQSINETLSRNGGTLSASDIDQIYETYLSPTRLSDRLENVGGQIVEEIDQVMVVSACCLPLSRVAPRMLAIVSSPPKRRNS